MKFGAAKLEMFAALKMIERFSPYLGNAKFLLRVDCSALTWLQTCGNENPLAARWIARLEGFNFTVEQRARGHHRNADGLSKRTNELQKKFVGESAEDKKQATLPFLDSEDLSKLLTRSYLDTAGVPGCLPGDPLSKSSEEGMTPPEASAPGKQQVNVQSVVGKTGEGVFHRDAVQSASVLPEMPDSDTGVLKQPSEIKITCIQSRYTLEELRQAQQADLAYSHHDASSTDAERSDQEPTDTSSHYAYRNAEEVVQQESIGPARINSKGIFLLDLDDGVSMVPRWSFQIASSSTSCKRHTNAWLTKEPPRPQKKWPDITNGQVIEMM